METSRGPVSRDDSFVLDGQMPPAEVAPNAEVLTTPVVDVKKGIYDLVFDADGFGPGIVG